MKPRDLVCQKIVSYLKVAMEPGVVAVRTEIIIINRHGARMLILVQPSGHRPKLAVELPSVDVFKPAATHVQFEKSP